VVEWTFHNTLNIEIPLFSLPEQHAITCILSDMDADEIVALEQRPDKTCAIKQKVMQYLLRDGCSW
jgi:restriction endonuclease S subunit